MALQVKRDNCPLVSPGNLVVRAKQEGGGKGLHRFSSRRLSFHCGLSHAPRAEDAPLALELAAALRPPLCQDASLLRRVGELLLQVRSLLPCG